MYTPTSSTSALKLFQQIGRSVRRAGMNSRQILQAAVDAIGWQFDIDRCLVLILDDREHEIEIRAQYQQSELKPLELRKYQLVANSEWYRLLAEGKPIPMTDIQADSSQTNQELVQLIAHSHSKSAIAFPLINQGQLLGCLTVHYCKEERNFSDEILEVVEAFAEDLAGVLQQSNFLQEKLLDGRVFTSSQIPLVLLEPATFKVNAANRAAAEILDGNESDLVGLPMLELFAESDAQRLRDCAQKISPTCPMVQMNGLLVPGAGGQTVTLDGSLSMIAEESHRELVLILFPSATDSAAQKDAASIAGANNGAGRMEELIGSLSRQLTWERITRQVISKLHSSLDRDVVLQSAADSVGRALRASACLIIRTESPAVSIITHEYADANLSPLGLGRSGQLPASAIALFKQRTVAINDLSGNSRHPGLSKEDVAVLQENGVGALLSTPIVHHGVVHGVIMVESNESREWTPYEVEMIETISQQAGIALSNAQNFMQMKDQLFNMNLINNLTQQLTNALDIAGRNARNERPVELAPTETPVTPLSSRELEVLKLIASGLANREIAQKLFLTESTVELHASRIRKKLKLKSRTALVKFACDNHLV